MTHYSTVWLRKIRIWTFRCVVVKWGLLPLGFSFKFSQDVILHDATKHQSVPTLYRQVHLYLRSPNVALPLYGLSLGFLVSPSCTLLLAFSPIVRHGLVLELGRAVVLLLAIEGVWYATKISNKPAGPNPAKADLLIDLTVLFWCLLFSTVSS